MASTDESVSLLLSMGFDKKSSQRALEISGGNVERAVEYLLSGNTINMDGATANTNFGVTNNSSQSSLLVQSDISQYSNPLGRSACTAIALTLAYNSIGQLGDGASPESVIDATLLSRSITDGINFYRELSENNSSGLEHSSVEDILVACSGKDNGIISSLSLLPNSPRQGILSNTSANQHMGLEALLTQCQMDSSESYIAVVITKTPETVLAIIPTHSAASNTNAKFILIDSHPRPQQLAPHFPKGSYALFHPTLSSLVASLREIFPLTELGDGVPELMQMMYNSFDVYPFQPG
mmetsp:Transcript_20113/g.33070  ORF Transcript_20113/g.33070 Transcript_20113/m.33070 type:complete len:295 (+) Transcript_20113:238-1122(+)